MLFCLSTPVSHYCNTVSHSCNAASLSYNTVSHSCNTAYPLLLYVLLTHSCYNAFPPLLLYCFPTPVIPLTHSCYTNSHSYYTAYPLLLYCSPTVVILLPFFNLFPVPLLLSSPGFPRDNCTSYMAKGPILVPPFVSSGEIRNMQYIRA